MCIFWSRSQARRPCDSLLDREERCQKCNLESGGSGAFALETLVMLDVTEHPGVNQSNDLLNVEPLRIK